MRHGFFDFILRKIYRAPGITLQIVSVSTQNGFLKHRFYCPHYFTCTPQPADYLRLWVPTQTKDKFVQREFTPTNLDPAQGEFDINYFSHDSTGSTLAWAQQAEVGEKIEATYWVGKYSYPSAEMTSWCLVGDPASQPAIIELIKTAPPSVKIEVIMEQQTTPEKNLPFPTHKNLRVTWVKPGGKAAAKTVQQIIVDWWFVALEAKSLRPVRKVLEGKDLEKEQSYLKIYWTRGRKPRLKK